MARCRGKPCDPQKGGYWLFHVLLQFGANIEQSTCIEMCMLHWLEQSMTVAERKLMFY